MKNKSLLLILPAATLLVSCGKEPGSDYKEVDKETIAKSAKAAKEEVKKDSFTLPKKFTISNSSKVSGKYDEDMAAGNAEIKTAIDIDNRYIYASVSGETGSDSANVETWMYVKDNAFVSAMSDGENKSYVKVETNVDTSFDEAMNKVGYENEDLKEMFVSIYDSIVKMASGINIDINVDAGGSNTSASYKFYKGKGDGDIKVEAFTKLSSSVMSYTSEAKMVTASYLPVLVTSKTTGNNEGSAFSVETSTTYDWDKCDLNYPDLTTFTAQ